MASTSSVPVKAPAPYATHAPCFATIAVVMAGGALLGVLGAILAVPVAASLKVIFREITAERRERMAALREAEPSGAT